MHRLTRETAQRAEQTAIDRYGMTSRVLMENAGRGCADFISQHGYQNILLLCGKGNNAGDGFVIARQLAMANISTQTMIFADQDAFSGDAAGNLEILCAMRLPHHFTNQESLTQDLLQATIGNPDCLVDCLLGTGGQGNPRDSFASAISWANQQSAARIAIDIPSGLDCDTGQAGHPTFRADHTLTMIASKVGFLQKSSQPYTGQIHIIDIGIAAPWLLDG